ncbi:methyltransferase domain-containing protein [Rhizobium rhizogenes]|uniref:methyltransferase domain-containing protein n=1 Tax=Rhizobium rhizogenes TaxID=359 RepID=UPI001573648F|nr:methyltransferase domain-containing protein [Rhizobium rhizogenes]NTF42805.1 class I SAM-dependent methyltransferase [Rhizobium rhizogenes]
MHDTAMAIGQKFFDNYAESCWRTVIEVGSMDVNGSLRSVAPDNVTYLGLDAEYGKSVDIKVKIGDPLPFRDNFADCLVSSSQLEHDEFFWITFLEYARVIRPGGLIYINAPSNGDYHRYPNDNWRFYPDCGKVLKKWAQKNGYDVELIESFVANRQNDVWNDFVCIFRKGSEYVEKGKFVSDEISCRNVWKVGAQEPERFSAIVEDRELFSRLPETVRSPDGN